ncbi:MAG: hypothetical protein A2V67_06810 [Deltaproteobacteria bacterium RBG_13_61_14]|nr:MAG: hypothetical protein A2V67_06810 [Deltaproteobacteria bacterium RBG_13_61_14]
MRLFLFSAAGRQRWACIAALMLALGAGFSGRAQEEAAAAPPLTDAAARAAIEQAWDAARETVVSGRDPSALEQNLASLRQSQWEAGIRDLPLIAAALIRTAADQARKGQTSSAERLLDWSRRLAPHQADFHLARACYWLGAGKMDPAAAGREYLQFLRKSRQDFDWSLRFLARLLWIVLWTGWVALSVLALALLARYLRVYMHDFHHLFPAGFLPRGLITALGLVLPLVPLMFGAPLWVVAGVWIAVLSLYSRTSERVIALALLAAIGGLPYLHALYAHLLAAPADPVLAAVLHVRRGVYSEAEVKALLAEAASDPAPLDVLLALASVHERQGRIEEAGKDFQRLLADTRSQSSPYQEVIYNNLGNLWVTAGDHRQALASYKAAALANPLPVEVAYNLSQVYRALLDMAQGDSWNNRAAAIDSARVDEWGEASTGLPLARRVVQIPIPLPLLWARALLDTPRAEAVRQASWREWARGMSFWVFSLVLVAAGLGVVLGWSLAGRLTVSRPCTSCGQPVCPRCHHLSKDPNLCSPCYHVFRAQGGIDPRVKLVRKAYARRFQEGWHTAGLLASVLVPGSGHLLQGSTGIGIALLLLASGWIAALLAPAGVWRPEVPALADGLPWGWLAAAAGYLVLVMVGTASYVAQFRD